MASFPTTVKTYSALASGKGLPFDVVQSYQDEITAIETQLLSKVQVYHNTTQSLTTATHTAVSFNAEDLDTLAYHSTVTNNSRITIPSGTPTDTYLVGATVTFAASATGIRVIRIRKNGTTDVVTAVAMPGVSSSGLGSHPHTCGIVSLAAADYVEVLAYQDSGGSLNIGDATNRQYQNQFFLVRV